MTMMTAKATPTAPPTSVPWAGLAMMNWSAVMKLRGLVSWEVPLLFPAFTTTSYLVPLSSPVSTSFLLMVSDLLAPLAPMGLQKTR